MSTQLKLLGSPSVAHDGAWLVPPPGKVSALLFYLAFDTWVNRQDIAYLFWPDIPGTNARSNLRKLLARAKALPYARDREAERNRLWQVDTDLKSFRGCKRPAVCDSRSALSR